jgi:BirA family biotin operon repressor/biotin-[acetyl-CoA-carboxylase] ligase
LIGRLAAAHRALPDRAEAPALAWRLRALPVCASTETELDRWIAGVGRKAAIPDSALLERPLAVLARRQRFGHGQQGRPWSSPPGGVWLSAALPWPVEATAAASLALAVAVGLALELEALALPVRIKWPNDLLLVGPEGSMGKVAGLLPGLRLRGGRVRWARVGVGLNGRNPVPPGAANLVPLLGVARADPLRLAARVLAGLEWAVAWGERPEAVRVLAERRLLLHPEPVWLAGEAWQPAGLASDGGLVLCRGSQQRVLHRHFPLAFKGAPEGAGSQAVAPGASGSPPSS